MNLPVVGLNGINFTGLYGIRKMLKDYPALSIRECMFRRKKGPLIPGNFCGRQSSRKRVDGPAADRELFDNAE